MKGKLYGIGVGPGDPELLTLKAKRLIEECDIVAVPVKKEGEYSVALNIAKGAVKIPEEKIQEIVFTMAKDKTKREACRQAAAEEIMKLLDEGKSIAMLALGDIGIYSLGVFDNLVIMKVGSHVKEVYDLLVERGMENNALIISNVGMDGEYVGPLIPDREYGYFTTMIIKSEM